MKMKKITIYIISFLFILSMAVACSGITIGDEDDRISINVGQNEGGEFELNIDEGDRNISLGGSQELPADFPDYVPFPNNSELIQVVTAEEEGTVKIFNLTLTLEGGNRLDEIQEFYTNHFEGLGYQGISGYFVEGTLYSEAFIQEGSEEYVGITLTYQSAESTNGALALSVYVVE